ncbi:MAG: PTS sugar transporter subunit IIB [Lachnospiraceae bacterium]|nr:PTS sugar transporter subunit IIB [Lachnospiraceae bacterium]
MVDLLRLDERLIHGQVAASWCKVLPSDTLLVVDDESANSDFLTKTLYMAAPKNMKTFVMTYEKALGVLNDPRCQTRHVFVVVRSIETFLNIAKNAADVQELQVSNYGRMVAATGKDRKSYAGNLFLDEDEAAKLKTVLETGIPCYMQMTPETPKKKLEDLLKNA